ncbi:MAG: MATE family efflux transporter [Methanobrevibacter sp.]|nr:MATE family efflux transporter [Methanobrevibacter sp.]
MSIPIILLLFFNETYTILDTYFLSQLGNDVIIAFGYIADMYYFYNRSGKGLGRGVSSMIARLIGAKDYENINNIVLHGILLIIIITIFSQITFALFGGDILKLFIGAKQVPYVYIYLECLCIFTIFIFLSEYSVELLNSEGDTKLSTAIMTLGVVLTIILDYIFIFPCKLGILGASLGTCLAYVITTLIFLYIYLIRKNHIVEFKLSDFKFDTKIIREILVNAIPISLDSLVVTSGLLIITQLKNFAPEFAIVAFVIIIRIQMFLFTPVQGLSRSCNIIVGHLFGAKRFKDTIKQLHNSILVSLVMNIVIALILILFLNVILSYFTNQANVISEVRSILYIIIIDLFLSSFIYNCNQSLVAVGRSPYSFYSVCVKFITNFIFIVVFCYLLNFGKIGILISFVVADLVQSIFAYSIFRLFISKEIKKDYGSPT